ncbi:MAG: hypothetical protein O7E52_15100 [Candidatus Poribacteria bacterium]|nr:hypothetical protein [Candidatus Poribacteria bacterium]
MIKTLRAEGFSVVVDPDDGTKLNYLMRKGLIEFLSDPIFVFVANIPIGVITSVIGNIFTQLKLPLGTQEDKTDIVIELDERGEKVRYSHTGKQISDERFNAILDSLDKRSQGYRESLKTTPPDPDRSIPIFLEHTTKIVGWGRGWIDSTGAFRVKLPITDDETRKRKQSGELKGFSPGGIVYRSTCSVCKGDYVDCNHIEGREYDGVECTVRLNDFAIAEISIVKDPVQPLAKFDNTKVPELRKNTMQTKRTIEDAHKSVEQLRIEVMQALGGKPLSPNTPFLDGLTLGEYLDLPDAEQAKLWEKWGNVDLEELEEVEVKPDAVPAR